MTDVQAKMLDDLLFNGVTFKTIPLFDGKMTIVLSSLVTENQIEVEKQMKDFSDSTPAHMVHTFSIKLVSQVLKGVKAGESDIKFKSPEEAESFMRSRPTVITDAIVKEHRDFENELRSITSVEELKENFITTPLTDVAPS